MYQEPHLFDILCYKSSVAHLSSAYCVASVWLGVRESERQNVSEAEIVITWR